MKIINSLEGNSKCEILFNIKAKCENVRILSDGDKLLDGKTWYAPTARLMIQIFVFQQELRTTESRDITIVHVTFRTSGEL